MFSFTALFGFGSLVIAILVFGVTYLLKGWKAALVATGLTVAGLVVLFGVMLFWILNSMPN
jgi:hypothetical protein